MCPSRGDSAGLRSAALAYAAQGWPVLPLRPRSKEPLTPHGLLDASTDPDRIEGWWAIWPDANIGLRTGVIFDVLDIDGPEGVASLKDRLPEQYQHDGPLSITGKGHHLLFAVTGARNGANLLTKVDFRGVNGYIVAPPSIHPKGHRYEWAAGRDNHHALPVAPQWLLDIVDTSTKSENRVFVSKDGTVTPLTGTFVHNLDILEVAASLGMRVIQKGTRLVALCPFHKEDTPSFTIYAKAPRQSFYCYGCNAWGDALDLRNGKPAGHR